jgi:hypothetical protein
VNNEKGHTLIFSNILMTLVSDLVNFFSSQSMKLETQ